jgi:hypothetical protein
MATVEDAATIWLAGRESHVHAHTYEMYSYLLRHQVLPTLGYVPFRALTLEHIDALAECLSAHGAGSGRGLAPRTVDRTVILLRYVLDCAVEHGLIEVNPARRPQSQSLIE